ncbi:hypothetical protein [Nonomuraea sp. NPDC023979]|uniref:hypothetical protein n=1 Tax=Nonomuraea sp. NPDC023979 TaxID=3154796 RepID=UPI0033DEA175
MRAFLTNLLTLKRPPQALGLTMAFVLAILLSSGCRSEFFPGESRAPSEVIAELRETGKVLGATTTEWYWDGHTDISDVIVVDVGGSSFRDALDRALGHLQGRGWKVTDPASSWRTRLVSGRWSGVSVAVEPLSSYIPASSEGFNEELDSSNLALFDALHRQNTSGHLLVLEAHAPDS